MKVELFNWDELYNRALEQSFNSTALKAKDNARAWFEKEYPQSVAEQECIEEAIDDMCDFTEDEPFFDTYGNYICSISKGTYWRYN